MNASAHARPPPPRAPLLSGLRGLLLLLFCCLSFGLEGSKAAHAAEPQTLQLVVSPGHDVFREFANTFTSVMRLPAWRISRQDAAAHELPAADLYIAVGMEAARQLAAQDHTSPVICVLLSRAQFESLQWQRNRPVSALWQDPPPARQLALLNALLPNVRKIGYLHAAADSKDVDRVRDAADALGLDLLPKVADTPIALRDALPGLLQDAGALLAGTSPAVFNRDSLGVILPAAYRAERVLIGSSPAVVRAGALATSFSTPLHIATDVIEWLKQAPGSQAPGSQAPGSQAPGSQAPGSQAPGSLPRARYPNHFDVIVNQAVARSLDIPLPTSDELVNRIRKQAPCPEHCP